MSYNSGIIVLHSVLLPLLIDKFQRQYIKAKFKGMDLLGVVNIPIMLAQINLFGHRTSFSSLKKNWLTKTIFFEIIARLDRFQRQYIQAEFKGMGLLLVINILARTYVFLPSANDTKTQPLARYLIQFQR